MESPASATVCYLILSSVEPSPPPQLPLPPPSTPPSLLLVGRTGEEHTAGLARPFGLDPAAIYARTAGLQGGSAVWHDGLAT